MLKSFKVLLGARWRWQCLTERAAALEVLSMSELQQQNVPRVCWFVLADQVVPLSEAGRTEKEIP